jgi:hypothetical protein
MPARWLPVSLIWIAGGFAFPLLNPATAMLSGGLQRYLSSSAGMSDELALRVAFTLVRIPLTVVLGILIAGTQCVVARSMRLPPRRWITAAAIAACIATLIFLPSTLVAQQVYGDTTRGPIRVVLLLIPGAGLLGALVSFMQKRSVRKEVFVPGGFVAASLVAAVVGVLVGK